VSLAIKYNTCLKKATEYSWVRFFLQTIWDIGCSYCLGRLFPVDTFFAPSAALLK
jgi:hypothetical protein